ncbi:DegT/DnrJ/EryC1/StrS family aminotransferase [bacterium]|nr:DegT/DnrJ/EryC1/StrS family aminotransferase [bacterium]
MIKFLDLHTQYLSIKDEVDSEIASVISESAFIGGRHVREFEENFAEYQQAKYCVGVGNGTDALEIAIEALNLPKHSEIIVPANSFIASAEAIVRSGHKIVFCDISADNYTINLEDLKRKITLNTSAIIAVHLYGHPCNMDLLLAIARKHNLKIIEDCAQAHGAEYKGKRIGAIGDVGCFSFYPGKNLGAYGDGGAIITNNEKIAIKCRMIANHGRTEKYNHEFEGRNSRLDGLQAAILNVKLQYLDIWTDHRIMIANIYIDEMKNITKIKVPIISGSVRHVYHLFVIRFPERDKLKEYLKSEKIETGIHYPIALPKLQAFNYINGDYDKFTACQIDKNLLSLPIGGHVSVDDAKRVTDLIRNF